MSASEQHVPADRPAREGARGYGEDRLLAALRVSEEFETSGLTRDEFLALHSELRDVLEVMLRDPSSTLAGASLERLGEFELVRRLGAGGSGVVYEALQLPMERRVAVKKLLHGALDERARLRFQREARLCASVQHPNIVRILSFGHEGDHAYLAMELVAGVPLGGVLKVLRNTSAESGEESRSAPPPTPATADAFWAILDQQLAEQGFAASAADRAARPQDAYLRLMVKLLWRVADALATVHRAGIVHRDVKPANILVRGDGVPMLTDFGVAREQGELGVTFTGEPTGTWYYLSPEQLERGPGQIDSAADVFALGVSLYEALTQRRPFDGPDRLAVTEQILHTRPLHPRRLLPSIDRDLAAVVMKALQRDARDRYPDAAAMGADLAAWLGGSPVKARPLPYGTRLLRWVGRNRVAAATIATFAVLSLILAGTLLDLQRRRDELADARLLARSRVFSLDWTKFVADGKWAEAPRLGELRSLQSHLEQMLANEERVRAASLEAPSDRIVQLVLTLVAEQLQRDRWWSPYMQKIVQAAELLPSRSEWDVVRQSIAAGRCIGTYSGLESLDDQQGLVPLEINTATGLWEFWHEPSGSRPARKNGQWVIGPDTGIVFVLIPPAPDQPAYFIAAHELTRGQWSRLAPPDMRDPSFFPQEASPDESGRHPAESFAPMDVFRVLGPWGLAIPSQVEWLDAAAVRRGNVPAKSVARDAAGNWQLVQFDDYLVPPVPGTGRHHLVGTRLPNPYGLYDVLGNVWDLLDTPGRGDGFSLAGGAVDQPRAPDEIWDTTLCRRGLGVPSVGVRCVRRLTGM